MGTAIRDANKYGRLTEARLAQLEAALGVRFPEDYRAFLLEHNGGRPHRKRFRFFNEGTAEEDASSLECFFPIHDQRSCKTHLGQSVEQVLQEYRQEHPDRGLLPIGRDHQGNWICLATAGAEAGRVFFHDRTVKKHSPVAETFTKFLDSLAEKGAVVCRDIPDMEVLRLAARWVRELGRHGSHDSKQVCAFDALTRKYGDREVCESKIYQLVERGLLTFFMSPSSAMPTDAGWAMVGQKPPP